METGGSSKYNRLKRGDQEKNNVIEGGDQTFLLHRFKKKSRMGTFDDATRTALHFSRVDQGYLSCYFLKTFKNKKKYFRIQIVRQILTHFFQKQKVESSIFI